MVRPPSGLAIDEADFSRTRPPPPEPGVPDGLVMDGEQVLLALAAIEKPEAPRRRTPSQTARDPRSGSGADLMTRFLSPHHATHPSEVVVLPYAHREQAAAATKLKFAANSAARVSLKPSAIYR